MPVLAPVIGVEHAHVDDAIDLDFHRLTGVGESRLWMLVLRASRADDGFIRRGSFADRRFDRQRLRRAKPGQPRPNGIRHQIANSFAIPQQQVVFKQEQRRVLAVCRQGSTGFAQVMFGDEKAPPQGQRWRWR
ncbi:hypothetical protein D3C75_987490 [compost metagenome]